MSVLSDRIRGIVGTPRGAAASDAFAIPDTQVPTEEPFAIDSGEWRGEVFIIERRFEPTVRHGVETVGAVADRTAAAAAHAPWFAGGAPARTPFVFFDLETTGLSGGAGTLAFLVGCGRFDDRAFVVQQFLLTAVRDEKAMLGAVGKLLEEAGALVSFNGKSFDAPLLETRHLFHRLAWAASGVPHVDVLHPARRFWNLDDCSLLALERRIVGARRTGDINGFEIPSRYFHFLRTGDARSLTAILDHNRLDLLTLAALTSRLLHLARVGPLEARTSHEALALGHVFAQAGLDLRAREAFERSISLSAAPEGAFDRTRVAALRALALAWRRARQFDRAADTWARLLQVRGCPANLAREATEALAIHHEHRRRDLASARAFALKSLSVDPVAAQPGTTWRRAVQHRLARIDRKLLISGSRTVSSSPPLFS
jgi:uncharacterized protein